MPIDLDGGALEASARGLLREHPELDVHAVVADFEEYLAPLAGKVGKVRLIHGERDQAEALAETLRELGFGDVAVPSPGDRVMIG